MALQERFGNIVNAVAAKWQKFSPAVDVAQTTEVQPESDDDLNPYMHDSVFGDYRVFMERMRVLRTRKGYYSEYDEMDAELPEFHSALDIVADNATRGDSDGEAPIVVKSPDKRVSTTLNDLIRRLNLNGSLWMLARDLGKYGERAVEVVVDGRTWNVTRLKPLATQYVLPQRDKFGNTDPKRAFLQVDDQGKELAAFHDWQVVHFANRKSLSDLTGTGLGFPIRRAFKQLRMMEDAVVIGRLTRAHNRLAYMVDTGDMAPEDAQKHLKKVKAALRKRRTISQLDNKQDLTFNPLSIEEDIFVATHKESKADVKVLQGDLTVGNLADLEYFQQKIFTGLKVPKPYLAHEKDSRAKSVMTEQDIQFARSVRRVQSVIHEGLKQLFDLQLTLKGIDPTTAKYTIGLPVISIIDELRTWQTWQLKMLCAQMMKQVFWPSDEWVLTEMLGFASDDVQKLLKGQVKPDKFNGLYQAPKVGAVANNAKQANTSESFEQSMTAIAEAHAALAAADPEDRAHFESLVTDLRDLYTERLRAA